MVRIVAGVVLADLVTPDQEDQPVLVGWLHWCGDQVLDQ
jgi:hypothetical protein